MTSEFLLINPYGHGRHLGIDPGYPLPAPATVSSVDPDCSCRWYQIGPEPWRLTHLNRKCPLHGWVEAPVGSLGALLAKAGRVNVPGPMHAPIRRLRIALARQRDVAAVRAGTADVRALAVWTSGFWVQQVLFRPIAELGDLIDWQAHPYDMREESVLRGDQ